MATANEVAKIIKKLGTADKLPSVPAVAREMGETLNGSFVGLVYDAEPVAFPALKLPATQKGVEQGRKSGLRFERIAARTGLSIADVRDFAEKAGVADLYTGRGRKIGSGSNGSSSASSGRRSSSKAAPASKQASGRGTSGRRGAKTKPAPASRTASRGTRGTRASAKAADPK